MSKTNRTQSDKDGFSNEEKESNYHETKNTAGNQYEPVWNGLQEYSDEIQHLMSILPRQRFDLNEKTDKQRLGFVERELSDGDILKWKPVISQCNWVETRITDLFYKIETLVIRPIIKSSNRENESWIELGDFRDILSKATDQKYSEKEVLSTLSFGSGTHIDIETIEQPCDTNDSTFTTFRLYSLLITPDRSSENTPGQQKPKQISIKPTLFYEKILRNTIDFESDPNFVKMDSRAIRLLEILYWNSISEKNNKGGFIPSPVNPDDIPYEELVELFPLENVTEV